MLDVKIKSQDKVLTKGKQKDFLDNEVTVYHKTDGVKVSVIKVQDNGNIDDYVISYKENIIHSGEYEYSIPLKIRRESIGASQFGFVIKHFEKLSQNSIPVNTELFFEYLMRKPTLCSDYNTKHKLILIGYAQTEYSIANGKVKTTPKELQTEKRMQYARELNTDTPLKLFQGVLGSERSFENGILHKPLKVLFNERKNSLVWGVDSLLLKDLFELFLEVPSIYGGVEEGVIFHSALDNLEPFKVQQETQHCPLHREKIKNRYRCTKENEEVYWSLVQGKASELALRVNSIKGTLKDKLSHLSNELNSLESGIKHSKKTSLNILDDIQVTQKSLIIKSLKGNNNALVLGKFRVLTKGHVRLINKAIKEYDNVVLCLVTSKDTQSTRKLRLDMLKAKYNNLTIIESSTGNISSIIRKSPLNINVVYQGSDRVNAYERQLKRITGTMVKEYKRALSSISQTKILDRIQDKEFFKENTPTSTHQFYDSIKSP